MSKKPSDEKGKANALLEPGGNIVCFNDTFPHLWKISSPSSVAGKNISQFFNDNDRVPGIIADVLSYGSWAGELKALDEKSFRFPVKAECDLISNEKGEPLYITWKCHPDGPCSASGREETGPSCKHGADERKKTVMLVDDDDLVRVVVHSMIEDTGYHVISSDSGRTALKISDAYEGTIDVLVTDIRMPCMDGKELAHALKRSRPGLKVVFISGHHGGIVNPGEEKIAGSPFLKKPFTIEMLSEAVQGVLGGELPS